MATTLIPSTASPRPVPGPGPARCVTVRADLLPDEVISARRAVVVRRRVLLAVLTLAVLLAGGYGYSKWQTRAARHELAQAQHSADSLRVQQNDYAPLVRAQNGTQTIRTQLHTLMTGDLQWQQLLTTLRAQAPAGLALTNVAGTISTGAGANAATTSNDPGAGVLNESGKSQVGTLTITGTAPDQKSVATYADRLGKVKGLAAPLISNVSAADRSVQFTLSAVLTSDALGGRYSNNAAANTGGN